MALWGSAVYATRPSASSKLTTAAGDRHTLRQSFIKNGALSTMGDSPAWAAGGVTVSVTYPISYLIQHTLEHLFHVRP